MKGLTKFLIWSVIGLMNAALIWAVFTIFSLGNYGMGTIIAIFVIAADWAVFSPKGYPYRYTLPALFFVFLLTIYPMYYTFKTAFTNYGTGNLFSREEAINTLLNDPSYFYEPEDGDILNFKVFVKYDDNFKPTEDFLILLKNGNDYYLTEKPEILKYNSKGQLTNAESRMYKIENDTVTINTNTYSVMRSETKMSESQALIVSIEDQNGKRYSYFYGIGDPTVASNSAYYNSVLREKYIKALEINYQAKKFRLSSRNIYRNFSETYRVYDISVKSESKGERKIYKTVVVNKLTNREVVENDSAFYDIDTNGNLKRLVGYIDNVGFSQFDKIINDPKISGPFLKIFIWTFLYALLSVIFTFIIGLVLALVLNDKNLKGKIIYRTLLIIPWAVPAFISALVWKNGFFNETYGIINKFFLGTFGIAPIKWMNDPFWAKVAVLILNTWLGFPYMMTVTLGALQSIPDELYEASSIDGASPWRQFSKITMPLLMIAVSPLLVMSFAFNFNNFTNIYLLTGGGPAIPGANTPAGSTDILISYTYKLAFDGRGQDFGFASAISIIIFIIVSGISYVNFKISGAFEEVNR